MAAQDPMEKAMEMVTGAVEALKEPAGDLAAKVSSIDLSGLKDRLMSGDIDDPAVRVAGGVVAGLVMGRVVRWIVR